MLEVVYIISAVAGFFAGIALVRENIKLWVLSAIIAILFGIVYVISVPELNLRTIFAIVSLSIWQVSFLFGNWENFINYEFSFLLFFLIMFVVWPSILIPTPLQRCSETHVTTEVITLVTTLDSGESVYEDGCIICQNTNLSSYQYYYRNEEGIPVEVQIPIKNTTIAYIGANESPYLQIVTQRECSGYYPNIQRHCLGIAYITYKLYVPEGSIQNVSTND